MYPESLAEAKHIATGIKRITRSIKKTNVVLCPPAIFIPAVSAYRTNNFFIGAQNINPEAGGSFTGEISYTQLPDFNVSFVIVGHSERRAMGESDELINKKVKAVVGFGMSAILCVGESKRDHNGDYFGFIKNQIHAGLKDVPKKSLDRVVVAYEPIWAIGAKEAMDSRALHEMSIFIRKVLKDMAGSASDDVRILYGGSVDRVNCDVLVREGNVSGLLVGRQSLKPKEFVEIIKLVDAI